MENRSLTIDNVTISDESDCYLIAEIGHNHQGSVDKAVEMIAEAASAGAHAVKFQKRSNRTLYTREFFDKPYENENSWGATYGEHREALEFDRSQYAELLACAGEHGVTFLSTAFDEPSAEFLADLEVPGFKIASADLNNTPLIRTVAAMGKPMIISTGGATTDDVRRGYSTAREVNDQVALLQCTASYPTDFDQMDLAVISSFREQYPEAVVGLSSHDNGIAMAVAAYVLGGRIVEKHFTLSRAMKGTDHKFSLEPQGLRKLARDLKRVRVALGDGRKVKYENEQAPIAKMSKKLVASGDLPEGHILTRDDIAAKSPGDGLPPYELPEFVGRTLVRAVSADEALSFDLVDGASG